MAPRADLTGSVGDSVSRSDDGRLGMMTEARRESAKMDLMSFAIALRMRADQMELATQSEGEMVAFRDDAPNAAQELDRIADELRVSARAP